jgi:hypothetical protein
MKFLVVMLGVAMMLPMAAWAQLAPPNASGVSMGEMHFLVKDVAAYKKFFAVLGATPAAEKDAMKVPGAVFIFKKGEPTGGSVGSMINHFGMQVPDTDAMVAKLKAAGYKTEIGANPGQYFIYGPDELMKIELLPNKALTMPIVFHHIHFFVADPGPNGGDAVKEMQAWYAKVFGAIPGRRAIFDAADLPGVNLTFSKSDTKTVGTAGRVVDNIGFEVPDLEGFCNKETAAGIKFDTPCTKKHGDKKYMVALTDPFGVKIVLTDNLDKM